MKLRNFIFYCSFFYSHYFVFITFGALELFYLLKKGACLFVFCFDLKIKGFFLLIHDFKVVLENLNKPLRSSSLFPWFLLKNVFSIFVGESGISSKFTLTLSKSPFCLFCLTVFISFFNNDNASEQLFITSVLVFLVSSLGYSSKLFNVI